MDYEAIYNNICYCRPNRLLPGFCERDGRELLQFNLRSQSYYGSHCLPSTWITCEGIDDYKHNVLEINYNQALTNGMNPDYARELPAHYLKHWGLLADTGAYVSVAPKHFAPEVPLEPVLHPVQLHAATSTPVKSSTAGFWKAFIPRSLSTSQT